MFTPSKILKRSISPFVHRFSWQLSPLSSIPGSSSAPGDTAGAPTWGRRRWPDGVPLLRACARKVSNSERLHRAFRPELDVLLSLRRAPLVG